MLILINPNQRLNAAVEVAVHDVSATDEVLFLAGIMEVIDARML